MKPTEILADCDRYLLGVADVLHELSSKFRLGSSDRVALLKQANDLMKIEDNLKQIKENWIAQQQSRRKTLVEAQQQYELEQDEQKKQKEAALLKTTCKSCSHYKWVHADSNPNKCGSKESTCNCTEYTSRETKDKTKE